MICAQKYFNNSYRVRCKSQNKFIPENLRKKLFLENPGIDPGTSHMLSERSTTWANSPSMWSADIQFLPVLRMMASSFRFCKIDKTS